MRQSGLRARRLAVGLALMLVAVAILPLLASADRQSSQAARCSARIPMGRLPGHVQVFRGGRRLRSPRFLEVGDRVRVLRPRRFTVSYESNSLELIHARIELTCRRVLLEP